MMINLNIDGTENEIVLKSKSVRYNRCVSPSVRPLAVSENAHITLEPHGIF